MTSVSASPLTQCCKDRDKDPKTYSQLATNKQQQTNKTVILKNITV